MKVRAIMLDATRTWFKRHGFIEVQGPVIIPAMQDRPNSLEVKYLDTKASLSQGLQPYAEVFIANLGKIYTIAPAFRVEKTRTNRHLTEYWRIEAEIPDCDLAGIIQIQEQLVIYICNRLSEGAEEELEVVRRDVKELERIRAPFPRMTYDDAIEMLQNDGFDIQWGSILNEEHEEHLSLRSRQPFFISEFPVGISTFFFQSNPERPELTMSVDLFAPEGYGEISSGGQPTIKREELSRKMKGEGLSLDEEKWHIDFKEICSIPYSGFALGVERLTQWICKLEHIKEASAFPVLMKNIYI